MPEHIAKTESRSGRTVEITRYDTPAGVSFRVYLTEPADELVHGRRILAGRTVFGIEAAGALISELADR